MISLGSLLKWGASGNQLQRQVCTFCSQAHHERGWAVHLLYGIHRTQHIGYMGYADNLRRRSGRDLLPDYFCPGNDRYFTGRCKSTVIFFVAVFLLFLLNLGTDIILQNMFHIFCFFADVLQIFTNLPFLLYDLGMFLLFFFNEHTQEADQ